MMKARAIAPALQHLAVPLVTPISVLAPPCTLYATIQRTEGMAGGVRSFSKRLGRAARSTTRSTERQVDLPLCIVYAAVSNATV